MAGIEQPQRNVRMPCGIACGNRRRNDQIVASVEHQGGLGEFRLVFITFRIVHKLVTEREFPMVAVMEDGDRAVASPSLQFLEWMAEAPAARELKRGSQQDQLTYVVVASCVERRQITSQT